MSRARLAAVLACACVAAPQPAAGQDDPPRGTPVVGGGTPNSAPLLEPGTYRDTILARETLFYAIEVEPGEQLRVRATIDADEETWEASSVYWLEGEVRTAVGEPIEIGYADSGDDEEEGASFAGDPGESLERLTEPVRTLREAADDSSRYFGPGTWYASFYARPTDEPIKRVEVPFSFELAKEGTAIADEPAAAVPPAPAAAPAPRPESQDEDSGIATGTIVLAAVGGLLLGIVVGGVLARRRRRGDAP